MSAAVQVNCLVKRYGTVVAVNDVSLSIDEGEIFGILGPNGAGKTTLIESMEGLRKPESGSVSVCGLDVSKETDKIKEIIGVQLQNTSIYDRIKVAEVLDLFARYYRNAVPTCELLAAVSLEEKKDSYVNTLSGGQKQRLALALALVNDPKVLFLDEPTTALDPQARRNIWGIIESLHQRGKTVILNTHSMEEAEQLCERVAIMDAGRVIALDTPANLIVSQKLSSAVEFMSNNGASKDFFEQLPGVTKVSQDGHRFVLHTDEASTLLTDLVHLNEEKHLKLEHISVRSSTLEDVFLNLTGKALRD